MPTVTFAKDWQAVFKRFDLETFQDFFEYSKGSLVNKNTKRDVLAFSLPLEDGNKEFFMKRFGSFAPRENKGKNTLTRDSILIQFVHIFGSRLGDGFGVAAMLDSMAH